ncbi:MAG TPA: flagellin, partial [Chloroflexota bacterium]|nr:flagellin [Chloroflexota bacterium]
MRLREGTFSDTVTRMSSGLRLTSAGDDTAAWMVGVRLSNRYRGWNEATQNIQNGVSLLETADTGARSVQDALARLRELAVQSANGTYGDQERQALHNEMSVLRESIFRAIDSTEFNQVSLLRGKSMQPPTLVDTSALATPATATGYTSETQTGTYSLEITQLAQRGAIIGNQPATPLPGGDPPTVMTIAGPGGVATAVITFLDPPAAWPAIINAAASTVGGTAEIVGPTTVLDDGTPLSPFYDGYLLFRTATVGSTETIAVSTNKFLDSTGYTSTPVAGAGLDMLGNLNGVAFSAKGLTISAGPGAGGASGLSLTLAASPPLGAVGDVDVTVPPEVIEDLTHIVQYAPDHLDEHLVTIPSFRLGVLANSGTNALGTVDLTTQANAQAA